MTARSQLHQLLDLVLDRNPEVAGQLEALFHVLDTQGVQALQMLQGVRALAQLTGGVSRSVPPEAARARARQVDPPL